MGRLKIPKFGKLIISHNAQETIYSRNRAPYLCSFETFLAFICTLELIYDLFRCPSELSPLWGGRVLCHGLVQWGPLQKSPVLGSFIAVTAPECFLLFYFNPARFSWGHD